MSLVDVKDLKVYYPARGGFWNRIIDNVKAVDGVSFSIEPGQTFGLVGESGSGKSTTGKTIVGLEQATSGQIFYDGKDVTKKSARHQMQYNKNVQMIFQDSMSSLNPEKRIFDIVAEPLKNFTSLSKEAIKLRVIELLEIVGISAESIYKYPHQFSGGQRQRIDIARAVATNPKLVVADEPVSALDLSVQAQVLNFMKKIQKDFNISYLFISHDLGVIRHMCTNIAIMNKGRLVEIGTRDEIYNNPLHIYTQRLLAAIPSTDVDNREANRQQRLAVEKKYREESDRYYDSEGLALPLQQVSNTHWVALPAEAIAKIKQSNDKEVAD